MTWKQFVSKIKAIPLKMISMFDFVSILLLCRGYSGVQNKLDTFKSHISHTWENIMNLFEDIYKISWEDVMKVASKLVFKY